MAPYYENSHTQQKSIIDFKRDKVGIAGKVVSIDYSPDESVYLALIRYSDGEERYILAPLGLKLGDTIKSGDKVELKPGNALPLKSIPTGTLVHNIELKPGKGGQLVRSPGGAARLMSKDAKYAYLRLPSGRMRPIPLDCLATIGQIWHIREKKVAPAEKGTAAALIPTPSAVIEPQPASVTQPPVVMPPESRAAVITEPQPVIPAQPVLPQEVPAPAPPPPPGSAVSPQTTVSPSSGTPYTIFEVIITGCTPKQKVTVHGERYSPSSGWRLWHKSVKADAQGRASIATSWGYKGEYQIWVTDEATGIKTQPVGVSVGYPPVSLAISVLPPAGPVGSPFKVTVTGGTPKHKLTIHGQKYSPASGWQFGHKNLKTDNHGRASTILSWRYKGEYNIWAVDEATGVETSSVTVIVR